MVTTADLRAISGVATNAVSDKIADAFNEYAARHGVNTQKRIALCLANICVETGGFRVLEESLNYSVAGLLKTFKGRISEADAQRLGRRADHAADQKAIANIVYGGEWGKKNLGNVRPTDGWDFRGSGPGQMTGRANFKRAQDATGIPFLTDPDLMRDPDGGLLGMLTLWAKSGMNELADADQVTVARKRWNGGTNGLAECKAALARANKLKLSVPPAPVGPDPAAMAGPGSEPIAKPAATTAATPTRRLNLFTALYAGGAIAIGAAWGWLVDLPCNLFGVLCQ